jgi:hypothetical protein
LIRIVGIQRETNPQKEFILLQNQGSLRLTLRGHLVVSDQALNSSNLTFGAHAFNDDVQIGPGMYVLLHSGYGNPRWTKTKDGQMVYYTYMNRADAVWEHESGPIHVLSTQHTFAERVPALLLR